MIQPALREILDTLGRHPAFSAVSRQVSAALAAGEGRALRLNGLTSEAKALYLVLLWQIVERPVIVVVDGSKRAEEWHELVQTFYAMVAGGRDRRRPRLIPAFDVLPFQGLSPHSEIVEQRAVGFDRLARGVTPITITPAASAVMRTEAPEFYRQLSITAKFGEELPLEDLVAHLESIGYERREPVEMVGEYSVRGGILDVFPAEAERPVRIEFFGDSVESVRTFDVETQRSVLKLNEVTLPPLIEYPRSRRLLSELGSESGEPFPGWEFHVARVRPRGSTIFDQTSPALVVLDEPEQIEGAVNRLWKRLEEPGREHPCPPSELYLRWEELQARLSSLTRLEVRRLDLDVGQWPEIASRPSMAFHGQIPAAVAEARSLGEQGQRVVFFAATNGEVERLADIFQEYSAPFQLAVDAPEGLPAYLAQRTYASEFASILVARGAVRRGVAFPGAAITIFGYEDLFEKQEAAAPAVRGSKMGAFAADIGDLKPGDYVVHSTHGIGQFLGIRELQQGDSKNEFMLIEYAAGAKLYVPLSRLDLIQRYRGTGENAPPVDKLGGATWSKTKSRVKAKMRDMAEELLKLYAARQMSEGFAYSPDSNWQREFEDSFEYAATKDQSQAAGEIKRDMESSRAMDRLLCGDVGFGKTEVAMRAAFKALGDGKQVAVLAPTTVLAFQHYETFKRRFAAFPVTVAMFSRFRNAKELKASAEELSEGKVDIAVGTHRILSEDVRFRDLGLLIIDEEQRFGVKHKERLKQMRQNVDVLSMSATPIPRTLHMSLLGLRDLSVIETPPKDRLSIHTVVARFNPDLIRTAIQQELARGGQVYFLHNRVESIFERAAMIQALVPEAKVGVGHGQMNEAALEKVLLGFMSHEFDVFVSTTIVENGIDIPLANTILIENSERYGLSELYQLRGRVGRSNRRAYAYLLVPEDKELTDVARKRLAALREFSDLGAGFKIAALDLELRGAGNLLGGEQHGHISDVGYDMYMKLLENTVAELRGQPVELEVRTTMSLGLDLRLEAGYIADEHQRLRAYKKIAECASEAEASKTLEELHDRYGPPPEAVKLLIRFAVIKSIAEKAGIESVERKQGALFLKFHPESGVDPNLLMRLVEANPAAQFTPAGILRIPSASSDPRQLLETLLSHVASLVPSAERA